MTRPYRRKCMCNHCTWCLRYLANKRRSGTLGARGLTHEQRVSFGSKAGKIVLERYGVDHFKKMSRAANRKRWSERETPAPRYCACGKVLLRNQKWSCSMRCREDRKRGGPLEPEPVTTRTCSTCVHSRPNPHAETGRTCERPGGTLRCKPYADAGGWEARQGG